MSYLDTLTPSRVRSHAVKARLRRDDVKTSFYLPQVLLRAAKARAAADGISLRSLLVQAVAAYLAQPRKEDDR